ncbi:hypothetical protein LCGC14_0602010 [marine sediment metagenome]|uniref:Uncharacterized protein n=1 Tax=marine sediment metagenome TaxID=412755 RepID=A0A0F9RF37_9ZZZZ
MSGENAAPRSVPAIDSVLNSSIEQVVGNKSDTHDGDSLKAFTHTMNEHVHNQSRVYPTLANGLDVISGAGWVLGEFKEIVPNAAIGSDFDIHYISIEALSANETYELVLYAVTTEIGRVRFIKNAVQDGTMNIPFQCDIQPAGTQIQAKLATESGADTARISIFYHYY